MTRCGLSVLWRLAMPLLRWWTVLATADGLGTAAIIQRSGKSKTSLWRWHKRFVAEGVNEFLRDKMHKTAEVKAWLANGSREGHRRAVKLGRWTMIPRRLSSVVCDKCGEIPGSR